MPCSRSRCMILNRGSSCAIAGVMSGVSAATAGSRRATLRRAACQFSRLGKECREVKPISEETCERAWLAAAEHLSTGSHTEYNLIVEIEKPAEHAKQDHAV